MGGGLSLSRLSRRGFLTLGTGATAAAALAGCGDSSAQQYSDVPHEARRSGPVELTMWAWSENLVARVKSFNASEQATRAQVKVKLNLIPDGSSGGYAKMYSALKAGNAPDVVQMEYPQIPSFVLNGGLVNIKKFADVYRKDYVGWAWQQCVYGDAVYGMPSGDSSLGYYYRKDLFDKWGLALPKTWADYARLAEQIRGHDSYIATFPLGNAAWFAAMAWQAGAIWFGTRNDHWVVNIDSDVSRKVASFWDNLVRKKLVKTENDLTSSFWKDLQTGQIVSYVAPGWVLPELPENVPTGKGKWRVADIPQWSEDTFASGTWGGSSYAVLHGSKYPKEATDFIFFLTHDPRSTNAAGFGGMPSSTNLNTVRRISAPDPYYGGQLVYDVFKKSDAHVDRKWGWIPSLDLTYDSLVAGFTAAANGNGTFTDALRSAQTDTVDQLKAKGLQVKTG